MKLKRLAATVSASFEDVLGRIENHEAVAECAIDDMRKAVAQIKVQLGRASVEHKQLQNTLTEAEQAVTDWQQRALAVADSDEEKALQCLERAEQQQSRAAELTDQVAEHQGLVDDLTQTLQRAEGELQSLNLKKTSLAARNARSRSLRKVERAGSKTSAVDAFDRWETSVLADEALDTVGRSTAADPLQQEFTASEQQTRLREKLAALKAGDAAS